MTYSTQNIPSGHTIAAPRIAYLDAAKAIAFYEKAFGAVEVMRFPPEGPIAHAEINIGDSLIMLTEEWPEGGRFSAETLGKTPISMTLCVPDVDAAYARAIEAGATSVQAPTNQFYGYRDATVQDPFGYSWAISMVLETMSVEEMNSRASGPDAQSPN